MSAILRRSIAVAARGSLRVNATAAAAAGRRTLGLRFNSTFKQEDQPRIRIGSEAPNFKALTTQGEIDFHEWIGDSWAVLFSHPADFTPVCTTELGAFSQLAPEFAKRNTKLIGLSADALEEHVAWIKDIEDVATGGSPFQFPVIADVDRKVSFLYDMVDQANFDKLNQGIAFTIRNVFIIDPSKKVRLFIVYPASTGRNTAEVLRVLDALQLADRAGVVTPANWTQGEDVIIPPSVSNADAAAKFGEFTEVKPYLRFTKEPVAKSSFAGSSSSSTANFILGATVVAGAFALSQVDDKDLAKVAQLKGVFEKLKNKEPVDIAKELGANDAASEAEWARLFDHLKNSPELVYRNKKDEK